MKSIGNAKRVVGPLAGGAVLAVAAVLLVQPGAGQSQSAGVAILPAGEPRRVTVAPVRAVEPVRELRFHGVVRSARRATLSFPTGGLLLRREVDLGDTVREGQVLARIDTRARADQAASLAASVDEIDARIAQARSDRERTERLFRLGAAPRAQLEQAEAQEQALVASRRATTARVREARRGHGDGVLRAPFDGVVTAVLLEPGEMASPGAPVVVLSGTGDLEVEVQVPEAVVGTLPSGADARVDLPLAGRTTLAARVQSIGHTAGAGRGQLFPVVVALDDDAGVAPGMTADVELQAVGSTELSVPVGAVSNPAGRHPTVFVVRDGAATREAIQIRHLLGDRVTVRGNLADGEQVVTGGQGFLLDGDAVEVLR